jgi:hypothetical protein
MDRNAMPIKPENRARYPKDWPVISAAIRERAKWRCEWTVGGCRCTARQYAVGHWRLCRELGASGSYWLWMPNYGSGPHDAAGQGLEWPSMQRWTFKDARQFAAELFDANPEDPKPIVIVLTVAHLNHEPEDVRSENHAALCQRHHLHYDRHHHAQTGYRTRKTAVRTPDMFAP